MTNDRNRTLRALLLAGLLLGTPALAQQGDPPAAVAEAEQARTIAGSDLTAPLFLCRADSWQTVRTAMTTSDQWLPPVRAFDNLAYIGNAFVGVWVLSTSDGLILFDATESEAEARDHLVPGLRTLGLDPANIRYVVVTHGHWDHFGGARWLQQTYGAKIVLSAADWSMIEALPKDAPERHDAEIPTRDIVATDGQVLRLGDTSVRLYLTPGHTPGTLSAIVPARLGNKTIPLSLFGSVALPASTEQTERAAGLRAYDRSVRRFAQISRGTQGILNTHVFADGTRERLDALQSKPARNPFLIGAQATQRYYAVLDHCLRAAIARKGAI